MPIACWPLQPGRPKSRRGGRITVGPLRIDAAQREARYRGQPLELSKTEFALLHELAREPRRMIAKDDLLQAVWGYPADATPNTRTVDTHAARLRRKLAAVGANGAIEGCRGYGYRLGLLDLEPAPAA